MIDLESQPQWQQSTLGDLDHSRANTFRHKLWRLPGTTTMCGKRQSRSMTNFFLFTVVTVVLCTPVVRCRQIDIAPNTVEVTVISGPQSLEYVVRGIDLNVSFVIFQVQTQQANLTVSLTKDWVYGLSESGSHVGVVKTLEDRQSGATFHVNASHVQNNTNLLALATTYNTTYPIPGGCNMEFPLVDDPNILTQHTSDQTVAQFEYASFNSARNTLSIGCEIASDQTQLSYDVYVYFLPETNLGQQTFVSHVQKMMTVSDIARTGTKIRTFEYNKGVTSIRVPSFYGQATIYGVVVKQTGVNSNVQEAAYVSAPVYPCTFSPSGSGDNCDHLEDMETQILCSVLGVFGLVLCFFGHRCFRFAMFAFGFLSFSYITQVLLGRFVTLNAAIILSLSGAGGLLGGALWLLFWWYAGFPVLSVLLGGMVSGFIFTSVLFNLTPLGTSTIFVTPFNFGMAFTCGVLVVPVFLLAFTRTLNIVSCAMIGSFLAILIPNTWIGGTLLYIVINVYRKCVLPDFMTAVLLVPIHWEETIMLVVWGLIFVGGIAFQLYREWGRPHFPPRPRKAGRGIIPVRVSVRTSSLDPDSSDGAPPPYNENEDFDERTPLLLPSRSQASEAPGQQEMEAHHSNTH